jgi:hypothetical protein
MDKICRFCFNAHVYNSLPKTEEDYYDTGLDDSNDACSITIGDKISGYQIYFNSGMGKPCNIEICQWISDLNGLYHSGKYHTIGVYYPKFCPECGRPLTEYEIDEVGQSYRKRNSDLSIYYIIVPRGDGYNYVVKDDNGNHILKSKDSNYEDMNVIFKNSYEGEEYINKYLNPDDYTTEKVLLDGKFFECISIQNSNR